MIKNPLKKLFVGVATALTVMAAYQMGREPETLPLMENGVSTNQPMRLMSSAPISDAPFDSIVIDVVRGEKDITSSITFPLKETAVIVRQTTDATEIKEIRKDSLLVTSMKNDGTSEQYTEGLFDKKPGLFSRTCLMLLPQSVRNRLIQSDIDLAKTLVQSVRQSQLDPKPGEPVPTYAVKDIEYKPASFGINKNEPDQGAMTKEVRTAQDGTVRIDIHTADKYVFVISSPDFTQSTEISGNQSLTTRQAKDGTIEQYTQKTDDPTETKKPTAIMPQPSRDQQAWISQQTANIRTAAAAAAVAPTN